MGILTALFFGSYAGTVTLGTVTLGTDLIYLVGTNCNFMKARRLGPNCFNFAID